MKKKRDKRRKKYRAAIRSQTLPRTPTPVAPAAKTTLAASSPALATSATQKEKYKYLLADLRQIGIIAGSLFLILIIMNFILD